MLFIFIDKKQISAKESASARTGVPAAPASFKSSLGLPMQFIPGGSFMLGMTEEEFEALWPERIDLEWAITKVSNPHKVTLSDFFMNATEITQYHYSKVMGINPSYFKGDDLPVERVTWFDAVEFCNKLSLLEGLTPYYTMVDRQPAQAYPIKKAKVATDPNANGYRLPTEAQWEYAAREGRWKIDRTVAYAGSPTIDNVGWYKGNSNYSTHPVANKQPNSFGLYDMAGNVWEYCQDWYGLYAGIDATDPQGPDTGTERVDRGGSWNYVALSHRSATRGSKPTGVTRNVLGFRVVLPLSAFEQLYGTARGRP
jgi:formylglycine-generating enzyme required for sulfatase activity